VLTTSAVLSLVPGEVGQDLLCGPVISFVSMVIWSVSFSQISEARGLVNHLQGDLAKFDIREEDR
jgi:hypothetical protein